MNHKTLYRKRRRTSRPAKGFVHQLQLRFEDARVDEYILPDNVCLRCGSKGFVFACHSRCRHCGFMPSCSD